VRYLPLFHDLAGRRVLVLGTGEVAQRKAEALARAEAEIVVRERFDPADLEGCALAIGADAAESELAALSDAARSRGVPVNVVDRPALCTAIMPAIVERGSIAIAISSAGVAPVLARLLRARIEAAIPQSYARLGAFAATFADEVRRRLPNVQARRRALERIFSGVAAELLFAGKELAARDAVEAEIAAAEAGGEYSSGILFLVGAGPGPAELLTLQAHRLLGEADIVAHDPAVSEAVLALARRDAARVKLAITDAEADSVAARAARAGNRVVWLVPGGGVAPSAALAQSGVPIVVVPGVGVAPPNARPGSPADY
jgi:uroporphyrin-III C-methyltransferase/precorrin-2 dehydrogenase/sirohydrochlorin ferrochelatase